MKIDFKILPEKILFAPIETSFDSLQFNVLIRLSVEENHANLGVEIN